MKVAIFGKYLDPSNAKYIQLLIDLCISKNWEISIYSEFEMQIKSEVNLPDNYAIFSSHAEMNKDCGLIFSLGGDGTLLNVLPLVRDSNIPVVGINTGRLGFLSSVPKEHLESAIHQIEQGNYKLDKRTLIRIESDQNVFSDVPFGLNEFSIYKKEVSSMITIHTYVDGEFLNTYWADGLMVATPTGSTAYSLSCGGPIVFPNSGNFLITPIAPHNLNVRPIVVSDESIISFKVEGRAESFYCTLDSQIASVNEGIKLEVKKETFTINLLRMQNENFLLTLRNKLNWGIDKRN